MNPLHLTDPTKIKTATTYNSAADHFDDAPLAFWEVTGRTTIERLHLKSGSTVLDVGCGSGASVLPAAEAVGGSGKVIGVDLADNLLERAHTKARRQQLANIEFRLGDMTELGYPDSTFDAVISVFSIFFVTDMEAQVRELWRMIKPGGKLAITTWGSGFFEPIYSIWRETVRVERPDLYSAFHPWDRISSPGQVQQLLLSGGVPNADIVPISANQALQLPEDWWTIVLGSGLRGTVDAMDAETAARVREKTVGWTRDNAVQTLQTNVIYAIAVKSN